MSNPQDSRETRLTGRPPFKTGKVPSGFGDRKKRQTGMQTPTGSSSRQPDATPERGSQTSTKPQTSRFKDAHPNEQGFAPTSSSRRQTPSTEAGPSESVGAAESPPAPSDRAMTIAPAEPSKEEQPSTTTNGSNGKAAAPSSNGKTAVVRSNGTAAAARSKKTAAVANPVYIGPPLSKLQIMKLTSGLFSTTAQPDVFNNVCESEGTGARVEDFDMQSAPEVNKKAPSPAKRRVVEQSKTAQDKSNRKAPVEPPVDRQTPDQDNVHFEMPDREIEDLAKPDRVEPPAEPVTHFMAAFQQFSQIFVGIPADHSGPPASPRRSPSEDRESRSSSVEWLPPPDVAPAPPVNAQLDNRESSGRARADARAPAGSDASSAQPTASDGRATREDSVQWIPPPAVTPAPETTAPLVNQESSRGSQADSKAPAGSDASSGQPTTSDGRATREDSVQWIPPVSPAPPATAQLDNENHSIVAQSEFSLRPRGTVSKPSSGPSTTVRTSPPERKRTSTTPQHHHNSSEGSSSSAPPPKRLAPASTRQRVEEEDVVHHRAPQRNELALLTEAQAVSEEDNDLWLQHVKKSLNRVLQEGTLLAPKQDFVAQAMSNILCEKDLIVVALAEKDCQVGNKKKTYHAVQLESVSNGVMKGKCLCPRQRAITMEIEQVVCDPALLASIHPTLHLENLPYEVYEVNHWQQAKSKFNRGMWSLIEVGQHFELQLEECPEFVAVVRVVANHYGLLEVAVGGHHRTVHMANPYCHGLGWVREQKDKPDGQNVEYVPGLHRMRENYATKVPSVVFRHNFISQHRVSENDVVAYLDPDQNAFYYAHIISRVPEDAHFFHLQIGKRKVVNPRPVEVFDVEKVSSEATDGMLLAAFHVHHRRIFPVDLVLQFGVEIKLPESGDRESVEAVTGLPYPSDAVFYIDRYTEGKGRCLGSHTGANHEHILRARALGPRKWSDIKAKMSTLRFVEILRENSDGVMKLKGAQVVKASRHMLCLKVANEEKHVYTHIADPNLFRYGTCADMSINIEWEPAIFMRDIKEEVEDDYPN